MLAGKCDAWVHLLGERPFLDPIRQGALDLCAVKHNSSRVRELMKQICPAVVANAESISRHVLFFPVSSFGHAPVRVGPGDYVPDPRQLKPFMVEVPVLWVLSTSSPSSCQPFRLATQNQRAMPWQLIYTSAPRGLTSGHSGFCTVARSADLREAVCVRLEQISSYHHLNVSSGVTRNPRIAAYRILDIRGG